MAKNSAVTSFFNQVTNPLELALKKIWAKTNQSQLRILVTGKTGQGKSTLINGILGDEVAVEGPGAKRCTTEVEMHSKIINGVPIAVFDSPGLQDRTHNEEEYIRGMREKCKELSLVIYCTKMINPRLGDDDKHAMSKLTKAFGDKFWEHAVFVLTFANMEDCDRRDDRDADTGPEPDFEDTKAWEALRMQRFKGRLMKWENILKYFLIKEVGVSSEIANEIFVIPTGDYKKTILNPNPKCLLDRDDWINMFWEACFLTRQKDRGENLQLQEEKKQLQKEKQQLQKEKRQLQGENQQLQGEKRQLQEEKRQLQGENQQLQGEKRQLQEEKRQLQGENQQLQGEKRQLQEEKRQLQGENQQLQGENQQLQGEKPRQLQGEKPRQLQSVNEQQLQGKYQQLQREYQQLQEKLKELPKVLAKEKSWKISHKDVKMTKQELGRGGWGVIWVGEFRGQKVAVKQMHELIASEEFLQLLHREINTMSQLRHPNLVQFIGAVLDDPSGNPLILTEIMDMSLREAYEKKKQLTPVPVDIPLAVMRDVAVGLNYLHCLPDPIIHRDVSSANVLLESKGHGRWKTKISDFGSAKFARAAVTKAAGAILYSAPEAFQSILDSHPLTPKMDVFSYGVLLCEVLTCQFPDQQAFKAMLEQVRTQHNRCLHDLIQSCIKRNPQDRPNMDQVIQQLDTI